MRSGEAGEVIGEIGAREGGRDERPCGMRMGDVNGLSGLAGFFEKGDGRRTAI